jgi:hypothetical protein
MLMGYEHRTLLDPGFEALPTLQPDGFNKGVALGSSGRYVQPFEIRMAKAYGPCLFHAFGLSVE